MDVDKPVKNIMSINYTFIYEDDDPSKTIDKILETPLHYIIVIDKLGHLVGALDLKCVLDLLKNDKKELSDVIIKDIPFVQDNQTLKDVMNEMIKKKLPFSVVLDQENKVIGTIDLLDIAFESDDLKDFIVNFIDLSRKVKE